MKWTTIAGCMAVGLALAATATACGDNMEKAKKVLVDAGYTNVELQKPTGGYKEIFFKANNKDGQVCEGKVVILRNTVDVQGKCADPNAEQAAEEARKETPLGKAEAGCGKGEAKACFEYGRLLVEGPPGDRNLKKARKIHTENCETRGNMDSCSALGHLYARAIGGKQDNTKAVALFDKACKAGHAGGCANQGRLAFVDQKYKEARELFERACKGGSHAGCNGLGTLLKQGKGGDEDMEQARKLFDEACDAGFDEACSNIGVMLVKGQGGAADKARGKDRLERACKANVGVACHQLKKLGLDK